ncbi:MAG: stilbene synthase [Chloroflexi bacterium]|nr:stilbene synthase [Chloroflexota bacterium]
MEIDFSQQPRVRAVATAVPPFKIEQTEAKAFAQACFQPGFKDVQRLLPIFDHTAIQSRYLAQALDWYTQPHSFPESNSLYEKVALELIEAAARQALNRARMPPSAIGLVIFVSTTGIATPSLDARLIQRLGLSPHTARLPVWGLGCAGGVAGLAHAAALAKSMPPKAVLLVAVELCSLTYQSSDLSKANLVATSLFGDGAAAAVLQMGGAGPEILGQHSTLFDNSEDVMGWDLVETGLKVRFSRNIPSIVREHLPALLHQACAKWGIARADLRHYVAHPGGAKVLAAYAESLGLSPDQLAPAYHILKAYGNMSSVSVLFVLEHFLATTPRSDEYGVMLALGPGFSAEQVLFRW